MTPAKNFKYRNQYKYMFSVNWFSMVKSCVGNWTNYDCSRLSNDRNIMFFCFWNLAREFSSEFLFRDGHFFGGNRFFWKMGWFTVVVALGRMYELAHYELGELISRSILIFRLNKVYTITRTRSWAMSWYMVCLCYLWRSSSIKLPPKKVYVSNQVDSKGNNYSKSRSFYVW